MGSILASRSMEHKGHRVAAGSYNPATIPYHSAVEVCAVDPCMLKLQCFVPKLVMHCRWDAVLST